MEDLTKKQYIRILSSDFLERYSFSSRDRQFRSFEKYLEKNGREYNIDEKEYIIYVEDKADAISLGLYFKLDHLEYYDGLECVILELPRKKNRGGRSRNIVVDKVSGNSMSLGQFKKQSQEEIHINFLASSEVIKRKIMTKKELMTAISDGKLKPVCVGSKDYINRLELMNFLKKFK